jgi:hypothetical protein
MTQSDNNFLQTKNRNSHSDQYHNSKQQILMYAMLLSPLGLFHEFFRFHFHLLCTEHQTRDPAGTTSANHADLLQYLLTSFVSAGQRPFIEKSHNPQVSQSFVE